MISNWYYCSVYDQSFLWNHLFQIKADSELQKSYDPIAQDLHNNPRHNKLIKKWWPNAFSSLTMNCIHCRLQDE